MVDHFKKTNFLVEIVKIKRNVAQGGICQDLPVPSHKLYMQTDLDLIIFQQFMTILQLHLF